MPLYDFSCPKCGITVEVFQKLDEATPTIPCSKFDCQGQAVRVITHGHGAALRDAPIWLDSAKTLLQPDGERPIESRGEYKKYLKEHRIAERC